MSKPLAGASGYRTVTLGCRVNQYETESIEAELRHAGWQPAPTEQPAELYIINTCTVTAKAAMQSRQAVRHAIRENPEAAIVVTGCCVQAEPDTFSEIPGVHWVIGNTDKHRIAEIIAGNPLIPDNAPQRRWQRIHGMSRLPETALPAAESRARPYLKIQDGCDDFCSYCIVPHTRGPSRSLRPETALASIRGLARQGAKEVVLTGIHLGRYGMDLTPPTTLCRLLRQIDAEAAVDRVRLSSIEPGELSPEIIQMARENARICPHFHIPLQSGDAGILQKMKRPYSPSLFSERVGAIHENLPHAAIGVDVLAGFPGEDEAAFSNTLELLASLPITYLHVFPFSPRPPTPASRAAGQVPPAVIKERCARLRSLSREKRSEFYQRQAGSRAEVILEDRRDRETGYLKGISANYLTVLTDAPDHNKNTRISCRLTGPVVAGGIMGQAIGPVE